MPESLRSLAVSAVMALAWLVPLTPGRADAGWFLFFAERAAARRNRSGHRYRWHLVLELIQFLWQYCCVSILEAYGSCLI